MKIFKTLFLLWLLGVVAVAQPITINLPTKVAISAFTVSTYQTNLVAIALEEGNTLYRFTPGSVAVVDGSTILSATGVAGRWIVEPTSVVGGGTDASTATAALSNLGGVHLAGDTMTGSLATVGLTNTGGFTNTGSISVVGTTLTAGLTNVGGFTNTGLAWLGDATVDSLTASKLVLSGADKSLESVTAGTAPAALLSLAGVRYVESIASLPLEDGTVGPVVCVSAGFAAPGDGGGQTWLYSATLPAWATVTNLMVVTNAGAGYWISAAALAGEPYNVAWFGADRTGVISCSTAVSNALAALKLSGTNNTLTFPSGTFLVGSPIVITQQVTIIGSGADRTTLVNSAGGNGACFDVNTIPNGSYYAPWQYGGTALAANAALGATNIVVADATGIVTNNWFLLWEDNTTENNSTLYKGETVFVRGVAGTTVNLWQPLARAYYTAATAKLAIVPQNSLSLRDIGFKNGTYGAFAARLAYTYGCTFERVKLVGISTLGVSQYYADGTVVRNSYFRGASQSANQGFAFDNVASTRLVLEDNIQEYTQGFFNVYCVFTLAKNNAAYHCAEAVSFHGYNRNCTEDGSLVVNGYNPVSHDKNLGTQLKNVTIIWPRASAGLYLDYETNCTVQNISVTWPHTLSLAVLEPNEIGVGTKIMQAQYCQNLSIDGLDSQGTIAGDDASYIWLISNGGTTRISDVNVDDSNSAASYYLFRVTGGTIYLSDITTSGRLLKDASAITSLVMDNCISASSLANALSLTFSAGTAVKSARCVFNGVPYNTIATRSIEALTSGSAEAVTTANPGSISMSGSGYLEVKESGVTATGWGKVLTGPVPGLLTADNIGAITNTITPSFSVHEKVVTGQSYDSSWKEWQAVSIALTTPATNLWGSSTTLQEVKELNSTSMYVTNNTTGIYLGLLLTNATVAGNEYTLQGWFTAEATTSLAFTKFPSIWTNLVFHTPNVIGTTPTLVRVSFVAVTTGGINVFRNDANAGTDFLIISNLQYTAGGYFGGHDGNRIFASAIDPNKAWRHVGGNTYSTKTIAATSDYIFADADTIVLVPTGAIDLTTALPTLVPGVINQVVDITSSSADAVTFNDNGSVAGTLLELGAATRAVATNDVLRLKYNGTSWVEVVFANN